MAKVPGPKDSVGENPETFFEDFPFFLMSYMHRVNPQEAYGITKNGQILRDIKEGRNFVNSQSEDVLPSEDNEHTFLQQPRKNDFSKEILYILGRDIHEGGQIETVSPEELGYHIENSPYSHIYSIKCPPGIIYKNNVKGEIIEYYFPSEDYDKETLKFPFPFSKSHLEEIVKYCVSRDKENDSLSEDFSSYLINAQKHLSQKDGEENLACTICDTRGAEELINLYDAAKKYEQDRQGYIQPTTLYEQTSQHEQSKN